MNIKKKFESIDQSQLSESQKGILAKIEEATKGFTITDEKSIEKVDTALDNIISKLEKTNPQAIKGEVKEVKPKREVTKKPAKSTTKTPKEPKKEAKGKRTIFSIAKEIRKADESWDEAKNRAKKIMEDEKKDTTKKMKTETDKLLAFIKRRKELDGLSGTSVKKDSKIEALPKGRRVSKKGWKNQHGESEGGKVYYENRDNRTDRLAPSFEDKIYLAEGGGVERINEGDKVTYKGNSYMVSKIVTKNIRGLYDVQYHLHPLKRNVESVVVDNSKFIKKLADGGTIIGTPETQLGRDLGISYTGLVGETGAMSSGEMFAGGGATKNFEYVPYQFIYRELDDPNFTPEIYSPEAVKEFIEDFNNDMETEYENWEDFNKGEENRNFQPMMIKQRKFADGGGVGAKTFYSLDQIEYNVEYSDKDGETYNETFKTKDEALNEIYKLKKLGYNIISKTRNFKDDGSFNGYFADGGTIIGTPETPLGRDLGISYTGLVGETGAMSSGEMFEQGGSLVDGYLTDPNFGDFQAGVYEMGGNTGLPAGAEQSYVNYYLNEGATAGMYANGGGVKKRSLKSVIHLVDWKGEGIKKWYLRSYPTDEMGEELDDTVTFKDLWDALNERKNVYEIIGVGDSLIRERLFEYLSLIYNVDYDVVYNKWLDSDDYAKGGAIPNNYEGRTPEDVWDNLTLKQRTHFLLDHYNNPKLYSSYRPFLKNEYKNLPIQLKDEFKFHVREGQYAYGGKAKSRPSMRELHIEQIASLTGTRSVGVQKFADDNNLTDSELSNLMTGVGRGMIKRSDFVTALAGEKNNPIQKEVVAFAKSDKAYKMADGGDVLPPSKTYGENLEKAMMKFNISNSEARKKYGQYTISQWEDLLSEKMSNGGVIGKEMTFNRHGEEEKGIIGEVNEDGSYNVATKYSSILVEPQDVIAINDAPKKKGFFFDEGGNIKKDKLYFKPVKVEKKDVLKFKNTLKSIGISSPYNEDISDKQFNIKQVEFYFKNEKDRDDAFAKYHELFADGGNVIDAFQMRTVRGVDTKPTEILTTDQKVEFAKGGSIKNEDIKVGEEFWLSNGDVIEIVRLFKENIDEDWVEYKRNGEKKENSVKELRLFINRLSGKKQKSWRERRNEYLEKLGQKEADVWDKIGAESGSEIRNSDKMLKAYAEGVQEMLQKEEVGKGSFDQEDYDFYTDENWHLFNEFLVWNGYYDPEMTKTEKAWREKRYADPKFRNYVSNPSIISLYGGSKSKSDKYIAKADIKEVWVKMDDGTRFTFKGSDVLNGVNVLEKGSLLKNNAKYIAKRNIMYVVLKNGEEVKPANGYWIKKDAKGELFKPENKAGKTGKLSFDDWMKKNNIEVYKRTYYWVADDGKGDYLYSGTKAEVMKSLREDYKKSYDDGGLLGNKEPREEDLITNIGKYGSRITKVTDSYVEFYDNKSMKMVSCKKSDLVLNNIDDDGDDDGFYEDEPNSWICKKSYEGGGKTTFKQKATAIAKNFKGKKVEPKYQKEYGKTYDKAEAKEVGNKIAGSMKAKYETKMKKGGGIKKTGGAMVLAKQIRKEGESWQSALKRANAQVRNK